jgi:hypothetical protein
VCARCTLRLLGVGSEERVYFVPSCVLDAHIDEVNARAAAWALSVQPKTVASWALRERAERVWGGDLGRWFPDSKGDTAWMAQSAANISAAAVSTAVEC